MSSRSKIIPYLTAIVSSCIFGLSYLFTKRALSVASPIELISFRFLTAFVVMSIFVVLNIIKINYKGKPLRTLLALSCFEPVIYFIFETYGLKHTSSSVGGLMVSLIPIAVTILAAFILKEVPSIKRVIFIITSVSGVALIVLMDSSSSGTQSSPLGIIFLLGAVLSAGFFNIISRKVSQNFSPFEITYFMMLIGALCFNIMSVCVHIKNGNLSSYFHPLTSIVFIESIIYLGIVSSIIAYFLINFSLSKLQASVVSIFSNLSTIVSIIAGVAVLKEKFYIYHIIGSILILVGVWGTNHMALKETSKSK